MGFNIFQFIRIFIPRTVKSLEFTEISLAQAIKPCARISLTRHGMNSRALQWDGPSHLQSLDLAVFRAGLDRFHLVIVGCSIPLVTCPILPCEYKQR